MCLGLSLCLLIGTFTLWGGLPLLDLTGLDISDILKLWSTPLLFSLGASLIAVLLKKNPPNRGFLIGISLGAGVLIIGGYALLFLRGHASDEAAVAVVASAALIGFGNGLLLLLWQNQLSQFPDNDVTKILLLALSVASGGYLLLLPLLQDFSGPVFMLIVLLAVLFCLIGASSPFGGQAALGANGNATYRKILLELRDPLFCVSAIAVAVSLTRVIALEGIEDGSPVNIAASAVIIVASLVLYAVWFGFGRPNPPEGSQNILKLYRIFFPVIATALLLLSVFGSALGLAVTTLVYAAFSIVSAFVMSTSVTIARKYHVWSPYVFGILAGCMYFVFMLATSLGPLVYYPKNFGAATFTIIVLLVLYVLAMSYFAIQSRRKKEPEQSGDEASPAPSETTFVDEVAQRCAILAEQNRLTAREKDILLLVARGRDVPSISKQLFISENTVRSHNKSVYKKLDIHSKQELLDLLETIPLEVSDASDEKP